jgi:hypothetical protein
VEVARVEAVTRKGQENSSFQFRSKAQRPGWGRILNDGELLQGLIYLCNTGFVIIRHTDRKNSIPGVPNTLVTLTHPHLLVTFRLKPFLSGI